jgi:hypothetical protein
MVIFLNRSCGACLVGQAMETSPLFDPKTSEKKNHRCGEFDPH